MVRAVKTTVDTNNLHDLVYYLVIWVVVKTVVPGWIPIKIRHLIFRVAKKGHHNFDNHPYVP